MSKPILIGGRRGSRGSAAASLSLLAAFSVAGCAAVPSAAPPAKQASTTGLIRGTAASCAGLTPSEQFGAAKLVFDGEMLAGELAPGTHGVLASPARVRVERYLKGHGPAVVAVQTAIKTPKAGAALVSEDGIRPRAGERWRIYASSRYQPYATSLCLGSRKLASGVRHFAASGISFSYPASWHARSYSMPPMPFARYLLWLSPQPMHDPCVTRHGTNSTTITCAEPIRGLRPHSLLAEWTINANPAWRFSRTRGTAITVAGHRAKWRVQRDLTGGPAFGETEVLEVVISVPHVRDSWYGLTAFIRGPDVDPLERQAWAMIRSVQWR